MFQIARFEDALADSILKIRVNARREAQVFSRLVYGSGLNKSGVSEMLGDAKAAQRYASNATELIIKTADAGKPLIKTVENRLKVIAVSENSSVYNNERRLAIADKAERLGLVEV